MHILSKIILFLLSSLCLFFLVFFTFITPSYDNSIQNDYTTLSTGTYVIHGEYPDYSIKPGDKLNNDLKMFNLSTGNNIYYYNGDIEQNDNNISLMQGTYYFDINSLDFNKEIIIDGAVIMPQGPGTFVINTNHKSQKSIFSMSSKIELNLHDPNDENKNGTLLDLYPNMFVMYNSKLNKQIINADLLRIQNVQYLDMINSFLYEQGVDSTGEEYYSLHKDIKKYVFFEDENNYDFIRKIHQVNEYQINLYKKKFTQLSKDHLYNFPGEKYIIKYYSYFQNDEKKKVYTKNIILKELIAMINSTGKDKTGEINNKLSELKELDKTEYINMVNTINHYYENILYSQHDSPDIVKNITKLVSEINNKDFSVQFPSLLTLRNIYKKYHNNNAYGFHKALNSFVDQYEVEMDMSIYDENHRIHSYFLYFIKNILIADFSKVEDHNNIITLFKKYIDIKNVFIEKGNDITKKTALFDNAQLLKVFVNITKVNFFEEELDDKGLLVLLKPAGITNENYLVLQNNINKLLEFHKDYQYFIENSNNRKDKILSLSYNKYTEKLGEYFLAMDNYNEYLLKYDTAAVNPTFEIEKNENILSLDQAIVFLKQFNGVSSIDTNIQIRDYAYCVQPIEENDLPIEKPQDGYCFKIENLTISGFIFSFILIPSDKNTITNLTYVDLEGKETSIGTNYVMDQIQEDMNRKFSSAQSSQRDKYDYKQFFRNNFINTLEQIVDTGNDEELNNEFSPPDSTTDTFQVRKIKLSLLSNNSYLAKIRNIIPISYDYLLLNRENNQYVAKIFPTEFQLNIQNGREIIKFLGKFQGAYNYGASDDENTFEDVKLLLQNPKETKKLIFLMHKTPIAIDGKFKVTQTELLLTKLLSKYGRIENIYYALYNDGNEGNINIVYNIEKNIVTYTLENGISIEYNMEGMVDVYIDDIKTTTIVYNKLGAYLNTLQ